MNNFIILNITYSHKLYNFFDNIKNKIAFKENIDLYNLYNDTEINFIPQYNDVFYKNDTSDFMFFHILYLDNNQRSPYLHSVLMPVLGKLNFNYLLRAKVNFYTQKEKHIKMSTM